MARNVYPVIEAVYDVLFKALPDIDVKIGIEKGIGAKECPFARIVATSVTREDMHDVLELVIYYGVDIKNEQTDTVYEKLFGIENRIRTALESGDVGGAVVFVNTVTDEDTVPNLKVAASTFRIRGVCG